MAKIRKLEAASHDDIDSLRHQVDQLILEPHIDRKVRVTGEQSVNARHDVDLSEGHRCAHRERAAHRGRGVDFPARLLQVRQDARTVLVPALTGFRDPQTTCGANDESAAQIALERAQLATDRRQRQ